MISLSNVNLYFGGRTLFDEISFMINPGDRIGLVGKNGAGKSTLLKLIAGEYTPNGGSISTSKGLRAGYLPQDLDFTDGRTVFEEAESAFEKIKAIESNLAQLRDELAQRTDTHSGEYLGLISRISGLEEEFALEEGYTIHSEINKVLLGLGFLASDFDKQTTSFSGGWRMRIELAKILLRKPDVLLLDEPTNHLDIESILWLEDFLKTYPGGMLLVSHDRTFLDNVTNRTIEISMGEIYDFKAPYSRYVTLRSEQQEKEEQAKKNQDKYIKHTEQLIEKFRYKKSKAAFAQSLIKKLDKMERIEVDSFENASMRFRFPPAPHSGKVPLKTELISKKYDSKQVLENVSIVVERGEKIAFVGKNGEGKTTLAKIIAGQAEYGGKLEYGHLVKLGYYAQNQSDLLDENLSVIETIENAAGKETSSKVRSLLGSFLFSGDDVYKKIKVLSGGERARVALCRLLLEPVNLLVMDEPTNHLDMQSKEILKQALLRYDGTLIIVSHDRDFLQGLTGRVYEFRNKNIKEYAGDVNEFLRVRKLSGFKGLETNTASPEKEKKKPSPQEKNYEKNMQWKKDLRKAENKISLIEKEIETLEKKIQATDTELADPEKFRILSSQQGFFGEYEKTRKQLEALTLKWEESVKHLEEIRKKTG